MTHVSKYYLEHRKGLEEHAKAEKDFRESYTKWLIEATDKYNNITKSQAMYFIDKYELLPISQYSGDDLPDWLLDYLGDYISRRETVSLYNLIESGIAGHRGHDITQDAIIDWVWDYMKETKTRGFINDW